MKHFKIQIPTEYEVQPPCPYFGECGGCQLQHLSKESYQQFKLDSIHEVLHSNSLKNMEFNKPFWLVEGTRRRVNFTAQKLKGKLQLGFRKNKSHQLVNIEKCLVIKDNLNMLIQPLKEVLVNILAEKQQAKIWLSSTQNCVDCYIEINGKTPPFTYEQREYLSTFSSTHKISKLTIKTNGYEDILYQETSPIVLFNDVPVAIHARAFLQASEEADNALTSIVKDYLKPYKLQNVADLFCGRGTFSFSFENSVKVTGFEADKPALEALNNAAKLAKRNVSGVYKNLYSEPINVNEINNFDAIILDPPRDGALKQVAEIGQSSVPAVVYVSCNPKTFARDAAVLVKNGYTLSKLTPVDQFIWSTHIELVALFCKN